MTITPKSPLEKLVYFQEEVDKLFRLLFDTSPISVNIDSEQYPPVDMYERKNDMVYEFELPDINKKELSLLVSNDLIVVEGVKKEMPKKGIKNYICMERVYGKFQRVVKIPSIVDARNAKAKYKSGILTITLPKIPDRRSKSIKITIE
jgi:HSP20 family protein